MEVCWNGDACKAVVLNKELCSLDELVLEYGAQPGVHKTRNIYGSCSNEVVPAS